MKDRPHRRLFEGPERSRATSALRPRAIVERGVAFELRAQAREGPAPEERFAERAGRD